MIAKALEHNGATVYIVSRRMAVLEAAARDHNVRRSTPFTSALLDLTSALSTLHSAEAISSRSRATSRRANPCKQWQTRSASDMAT